MSSSRTSADHPAAALRMDDVAVAYGGDIVLTGVSGEVRAGDSLALVGPNGAGKTTFIRAVLGLVPIAGGSIEVLGTTPQLARRRVAYVPQAETLDVDFPVTALQVVLMGRYPRIGWFRRPSKSDRDVAMQALDQVGLSEIGGARYGILSGGQRQRVLLARAIAQEADLLLLDEPFNGVDTGTTELVLRVLQQLRDQGAAVVMSTHDLSIAHLACTDACLLNHHQYAFGSVAQTLTPELLRQTYGGGAVLMAGGSTVVATQ